MFFSMWDGVYVKKLTTTSTILVNTRSVKRKFREMRSGGLVRGILGPDY